MSKLFPKLLELWKPLFLSLGLEEPRVSCDLSIETNSVPNVKGYNSSYQLNSSLGYLHIEQSSVAAINQVITNKNIIGSDEILVSYFIRRFLVTLEKAWAGKEKIKIFYTDSPASLSTEFPAKATINFELGNHRIKIILGIPIAIVEMINLAVLDTQKTQLEQQTEVSIELFGIHVAAEMLIDYVRGGNVIKAPKIFSSEVNLLANGRPWAQGKLKTCQDKFAVELTNFASRRAESSAGQTRISVQLERFKVDEDFSSYQSPGTIMLTNVLLNTPVSLVVSGEKIANALMGVSEENKPLLKLLSKS